MQYLVTWAIDIEANTAVEAAVEALDTQQDFESTSTVFHVTDDDGRTWQVDLSEHTVHEIKRSAPKVQIIHSRDPDMGCEHSVYVDGVKLDDTGYEVEDIDPGAGAERADWNERIADARKDTSAFGQELLDLLGAYSDSPYIEDAL